MLETTGEKGMGGLAACGRICGGGGGRSRGGGSDGGPGDEICINITNV